MLKCYELQSKILYKYNRELGDTCTEISKVYRKQGGKTYLIVIALFSDYIIIDIANGKHFVRQQVEIAKKNLGSEHEKKFIEFCEPFNSDSLITF